MDFRGHGQSGRGSRDLTCEVLTDDLAAVIRAVQPTPLFHLVGFSLGAGVALHYVLGSHGPLPLSLTVVGSHAKISDGELAKGREGFRRLAKGPVLESLHRSLMEREWTSEEMIAAISRSTNDIEPAQLQNIHCRTLVVHGDRDPLVSYRHAIDMYEQIQNSQLLLLPGAGHNAHREKQEVFATALSGFIGARETETSPVAI
jgi:pimeloyl-ACP methyl ester carboxylesterase